MYSALARCSADGAISVFRSYPWPWLHRTAASSSPVAVGDVPDNLAGVVDRVGVAARGVVDGQQVAHMTVLPQESVVGAAGDVAGGADPVRGACRPGGPDGEGQADRARGEPHRLKAATSHIS